MADGLRGWWKGSLTKDAFETRTRERFARLDRNSDGVIEASEVEAATTSRVKSGPMSGMGGRMGERWLREFDEDRDGKVGRDEFLAGVKRRFAELDLDRDGRITDADLPPLMRNRKALAGTDFAQGKGRHGHQGPLAMLRDADADKDGVITWEEASAAAEKRFALHDRNKDGVLDAADTEMLRKEMIDYRVKRMLHHHGAGADGKVTREQFTAKATERFARMDHDNDGIVSRSEMPGRKHGRHMGHGSGHAEHGKRGPGPSEADPAIDGKTAPGKGSGPQFAPGK